MVTYNGWSDVSDHGCVLGRLAVLSYIISVCLTLTMHSCLYNTYTGREFVSLSGRRYIIWRDRHFVHGLYKVTMNYNVALTQTSTSNSVYIMVPAVTEKWNYISYE